MRCNVGVCVLVLAGSFVLCGHAPVFAATPAPDATPSPSPQQIFYSTFKRLLSYPAPAYLIELSTWHSISPGGAEGNFTWRYAVRGSDGMENYTAYRPSARTLPDRSWVHTGFVGPLAWLVRPPPASPHATPIPDAPDVPDLKTIASVTAYRPDYSITLAGIETVQGHRTYHLSLSPYGDGVKHNLRDLWSDVETYDLWAARYLAKCGFCEAPRATTVVKLATFENPCGNAGSPPCIFEILTDKIVFVPSLPDWLFDEAAYRAHQQAHEPDYLAPIIDPPSPSPSPSP
jgi:hypothetical protein